MENNSENLVDEVMASMGLETNKDLSDLSGVSEKTIIGWKKKISPLGKIVLRLLLENYDLNEELKDFRELKKILNR